MRPAGSLRRRGRACALQILYQMDICGELVGARTARGRARQAVHAFSVAFGEGDPEASEVAAGLVEGVAADLMALDAQIAHVSRNWRLSRMAVVDRNVLRLLAHEMGGPAGLPRAIAVNEGVEMARTFGGAESPSFVNAVLDRLVPAAPARGARAPCEA